MAYDNLDNFVRALEQAGELKRIAYPVKAELEITSRGNLCHFLVVVQLAQDLSLRSR